MISLPSSDGRRVALEAEHAESLALVAVNFPASGASRLTDGPRDLVVGGQTYGAHAGLAGVSQLTPAEAGAGRDLLELVFLDPEPGAASWYYRFTHHGHTGITMRLSAVFDNAGVLSLPFSVYAGHCVAVNLVWNETGGRTVVVRFAGPFGRRSGNTQVATDTAQRGRRSTDRSLKYIATTRNIQWGRQIPKDWTSPHPDGTL